MRHYLMILKKLRRIMKLVEMNGKNLWQIKKAIFQDGLFINEHEYPDILIYAYFVVLLQPDFLSNT